jgi:hypothetical protein
MDFPARFPYPWAGGEEDRVDEDCHGNDQGWPQIPASVEKAPLGGSGKWPADSVP